MSGSPARARGRIEVALGDTGGAIVEFSCETDFIARNRDFVAMTRDVCDRLLSRDIVDPDDDPHIDKVITALRRSTRESICFERCDRLAGPDVLGASAPDGRVGFLLRVANAAHREQIAAFIRMLHHEPSRLGKEDELVVRIRHLGGADLICFRLGEGE